MKPDVIKILYLIAHCGQGGDWSVVKTLAGLMPEEQTEVWLNGARWCQGTEPPDGPLRINQGWRSLLNVKRTGRDLPPDLDIIHAHSPAAILIALAIRFWHAPKARIVFTFHWPTKDSLPRRWVKRYLLNKATALHCVSLQTKALLQEVYKVPESRLALIYLGVNSKRFREMDKATRSACRAGLDLGDEHFVLGYLGRFDLEKNVDWLIRFVSEQGCAYPQLRLVLYGGGALEEQLKRDAEELVRKGSVRFAGYTRQPEKAYGLMDLHVLPSSFEAFPLTVVEAALCGVPTLRTNVEGSIDQIEDGVDGFLCEHDDGYPAFAQRLKHILDEERLNLPEIGRRSSRKLRTLCDMERFGREILDLYRATSRD